MRVVIAGGSVLLREGLERLLGENGLPSSGSDSRRAPAVLLSLRF